MLTVYKVIYRLNILTIHKVIHIQTTVHILIVYMMIYRLDIRTYVLTAVLTL